MLSRRGIAHVTEDSYTCSPSMRR